MSNDPEPSAGHRGVYRRGEVADLPAIQRVDEAVFGETVAYPFFVLRQLVDLFKEYSVVVLDGEEIVGYALIGVEPGTDASSDVAWLLGLGVVPECRGRGYGPELLARALDLCDKAGIRTVKITVRPTNESAKRLYRKAGFVPVHAEDTYFGPDEPRDVLRLELGRDRGTRAFRR
jgi:ribosomal protein S18 acetylase RimI-like enzyme